MAPRTRSGDPPAATTADLAPGGSDGAGPSTAPALVAAPSVVDALNLIQQLQQRDEQLLQQQQLQLQVVQQLQQQMQQPAPAPPAPQPAGQLPLLGDVRTPSGADVVDFINVLSHQNGHLDEAHKVHQAVTLLRKEVLQWWEAQSGTGLQAEILASDHPWQAFRRALLDRFQPDSDEPLTQLLRLRQRTSVRAYMEDFHRLQGQAKPMEDHVLKVIFLEGLHKSVRANVRGHKPDTLNAAMSRALLFDAESTDSQQLPRKPHRFQRNGPAPPSGTSKPKVTCTYCGKVGHPESACWKKRATQKDFSGSRPAGTQQGKRGERGKMP